MIQRPPRSPRPDTPVPYTTLFRSMRPPRRRRSGRPTPIRKGHVPANADPIELTIDLVGGRGDGVGRASVKLDWEVRERPVFVPFTLPGERVLARPETDRGEGVSASPIELIEASPDRVEPPCPHFMVCGGCALQPWADAPYGDWKAEQVRGHLRRVGLGDVRSEEHTSELQSLMRISYAVFCLNK